MAAHPPLATDDSSHTAGTFQRSVAALFEYSRRALVLVWTTNRALSIALGALTPREKEVLGWMAEGRTNTAIARALVVTPGAVEKHISNIFSKLDLPATDEDHRRVLAVLAFLRGG